MILEKYIRAVQDMDEGCKTVVRYSEGVTYEFKVEVGSHQGSALSPFMFAVVMDRLTEEVRQTMDYDVDADDMVMFLQEQGPGRGETGEVEVFPGKEKKGMKVQYGFSEQRHEGS